MSAVVAVEIKARPADAHEIAEGIGLLPEEHVVAPGASTTIEQGEGRVDVRVTRALVSTVQELVDRYPRAYMNVRMEP